MHDLYCPRMKQDPKFNPGHVPCPEFAKDNCKGCIIYENQTPKWDRYKTFKKGEEK